MSNNPFTQFISLITLDHTIQSFITKKASIDAVITEINNKKNEQEVVINDIAKKVMQFKKNVDSQELEMKALDQQEKEKKQLLSKLTDYKECQSVKTAVDGIQRLQVAQEKSVLDAWNQLENAQLLLAKKTG